MNQLQSGPVVVSMTVKDPLFDYECGIYCHEVVHTASQCEDVGSGHSVELLTMGPLIQVWTSGLLRTVGGVIGERMATLE